MCVHACVHFCVFMTELSIEWRMIERVIFDAEIKSFGKENLSTS